jgi:mRNA interferase MazF
MSVKRGDIYYADLSPVVGSEQGGLRPVLIIQNDVGNRYSPTVIAAAITSRLSKTRLPTHIDVFADRVGLVKDSVILLEQVRTLDKRRLKEKMGHLDEGLMRRVDRAIAVSVGLGDWQPSDRVTAAPLPDSPEVPAAAAVASTAPVDTGAAISPTPFAESPATTG